MPDSLYSSARDSRRPNLRRRLRRLKVPLLFVSLSVLPGLVSFRVYGTILDAAVVTILTALSISAAAFLFRPR
ncbi:hypothetical protein AB4Z09_11755 [Rhodococcus sp. TAF43]|uniref:hypothetical protein n=1 Tax=unclassified Rhodococcus (in: high G+C Gram-positive bacteria) TaxID=192944 RepID=UPI000E0AF91B|nr:MULTISPECIES: hypothetical protein [unclassified Rhodococcus (in: high G+C Gram-positive bacteria)]QKT12469.1 hypothetical protein HUN07_18760 [Rhodococcus sp. W8901]RDI22595.1 hypothetical protein DEU38_113163 [Rhodococcus sp. AG1013]